MATKEILQRFGNRLTAARKAYAAFVSEGVEKGARLDLTGGGLVRSFGGWQNIRSARQAGESLKSDERILGDSCFVDTVLEAAGEKLETRARYRLQGIDLEALLGIVSGLTGVGAKEIRSGGKQPRRVQARSLLCYWATRELGLTATSLARTLNLTQPAVSLAARRGEVFAVGNGWCLSSILEQNL